MRFMLIERIGPGPGDIARTRNLTLLTAHVALGRIAEKRKGSTHIHEGSWASDHAYSTVYSHDGDQFFDAYAMVRVDREYGLKP